MNAELQGFLMQIGSGLMIGAVVGMMIRWGRPNWARRWTKFVLNRNWQIFAFGMVFFGLAAMILWSEGRIYHAMASVILCGIEIVALLLYGFKPLTAEMERKIDQM